MMCFIRMSAEQLCSGPVDGCAPVTESEPGEEPLTLHDLVGGLKVPDSLFLFYGDEG
jgi:hypothetical protein